MDFFTRSVHRDYQNGTNDVELAANILSEDLEQPDWYLKYARNIINLILYVSGGLFFDSFFDFYILGTGLNDYFSKTSQIFCIALICFLWFINNHFEEKLGEDSSLAWWFTHIRFWLVLLSIGFLVLYIGIMVASVASF